MIANVIAFEHPTAKIYKTLPIPRQDLDEVLAVVFTGVKEPSQDDLKRTPVLVHRNRVKLALEWLKLNHSEYADLRIDYDTLNQYPLEDIPVDTYTTRPHPTTATSPPKQRANLTMKMNSELIPALALSRSMVSQLKSLKECLPWNRKLPQYSTFTMEVL